jgi:glycosyltransferase involved in cell wall biosynthesis
LRRKHKFDATILIPLIRILKREKVRIAHLFLPGNTLGRIGCILARVPVILASEESLRTGMTWYEKLIARTLAPFTTAIVCNSQATLESAHRATGIDRARFAMIWNGFDRPEHACVPEPRRQAWRLLSVGRLDRRKGYQTVLPLLRRLIDEGRSDFISTIVGEGG